jgi:hypothetical protein
LNTWKAFSTRLNELLTDGGIEHTQYEAKNRSKLLDELKATLTSEGRI